MRVLQRGPGGVNHEASQPYENEQRLKPPGVGSQSSKLIQARAFTVHGCFLFVNDFRPNYFISYLDVGGVARLALLVSADLRKKGTQGGYLPGQMAHELHRWQE